MLKRKNYMKISLDELSNLPLHDQCIENFNIDFSANEIKIKVGVYNESKKDYNYLEIIFADVEQIDISNFDIENFSSVEIYSHEVKLTSGNNKPTFQLVLLLGSGNPNVVIHFSFGSCYKVPL